MERPGDYKCDALTRGRAHYLVKTGISQLYLLRLTVACSSLQVAGERLSYLLDVYFFTQEDIDMNSQVMRWPEKIRPIFEQSEAVCLTHTIFME